ncbi:MAG: aspartate aminotransferase family protein [Sterolibacterium sp.]|jgi:glutamate-1-semialdehyde 2,1-aminomutase
MFPDLSSKSATLFERAKRVMPGGNTRHMITFGPYLVFAESGTGCRLTDVDGNNYIDWVNNFSGQIHGHGAPFITAAVRDQLDRLTSCILPTEPEIELAEIIAGRVEGIEQIRFANSGTEAVMVAIKAARAHTGRTRIAKCEGGYHGQYDLVETSFLPTPENWGPLERPGVTPFARGTPTCLLDSVTVIPFNETAISLRLLEEGASDLAAVIVDPIPARLGFTRAVKEYLEMLRAFCTRNGTVLIFDEVFCHRVGYHGAQGLAGVIPDMTVLGKIIGGGFPVGAVGGKADVMCVFDNLAGPLKISHSGTYTANPITMVAGIASMKALTPEAFDRLSRQGDRLRAGLTRKLAAAGLKMRANGLASMTSLQFFSDPIRTYREFHVSSGENYMARMQRMHRVLLNEGVLMATRGMMIGSTPMTDADIDETIERCGRGFIAFAREDRAAV